MTISGPPEGGDPQTSARTTLPTVFERLFVLPKPINVSIEHYGQPSVPCYQLPERHQAMASLPGYTGLARVTRTLSGAESMEWSPYTCPTLGIPLGECHCTHQAPRLVLHAAELALRP